MLIFDIFTQHNRPTQKCIANNWWIFVLRCAGGANELVWYYSGYIRYDALSAHLDPFTCTFFLLDVFLIMLCCLQGVFFIHMQSLWSKAARRL